MAAAPAGPVPHRVTQLSGAQDYSIAECTCVEGYQGVGARWGKGRSMSHDDGVQHRAWALVAYLRASRALADGAAWDVAAAHAVASVATDQDNVCMPVEWLLAYERGQAEPLERLCARAADRAHRSAGLGCSHPPRCGHGSPVGTSGGRPFMSLRGWRRDLRNRVTGAGSSPAAGIGMAHIDWPHAVGVLASSPADAPPCGLLEAAGARGPVARGAAAHRQTDRSAGVLNPTVAD
jgi:hypothetical protein